MILPTNYGCSNRQVLNGKEVHVDIKGSSELVQPLNMMAQCQVLDPVDLDK